MKNTLSDVHDHVVAAMERLGDEGLSPERMAAEAQRGLAVAALARRSVDIGRLALDAAALAGGDDVPPMLEHRRPNGRPA